MYGYCVIATQNTDWLLFWYKVRRKLRNLRQGGVSYLTINLPVGLWQGRELFVLSEILRILCVSLLPWGLLVVLTE